MVPTALKNTAAERIILTDSLQELKESKYDQGDNARSDRHRFDHLIYTMSHV